MRYAHEEGSAGLCCSVCHLSVLSRNGDCRSSTVFSTLADFSGPNGAYPYLISLVQGKDANLYGTTQQGGLNSQGTVFKISPSGTLTTLYNFCSQTNCSDGAYPYGGLVLGTDGNFYGTTSGGGAGSYGTVFKITPRGTLTTLYSFFNGADGAIPRSAGSSHRR
jgi:uncharacterized repeat protein (TIGR03803 family)